MSRRSGLESVELALPELAECIDADLGISPSTNTLPIRRLNLAVGESRELTAAWVRFPELTVEPLAQRYTRLAERRYRYESTVSGFTAELEVDDLGLVISYENIWQRVAESKQILTTEFAENTEGVAGPADLQSKCSLEA